MIVIFLNPGSNEEKKERKKEKNKGSKMSIPRFY